LPADERPANRPCPWLPKTKETRDTDDGRSAIRPEQQQGHPAAATATSFCVARGPTNERPERNPS